MIRFLLPVFFVTSAYGNVLHRNSQEIFHWLRINGMPGEKAEISEAPYQVAMLYASPEGYLYQACGGSIINPKTIVSVAHCPHKTSPADWKIRAGSTQSDSGGQLLNVSQIIMHPKYNENTIDYDISLYILASNINIDGVNTEVIPLPAQNALVDDNATAIVTGWGSFNEGGSTVRSLRKIKVPIVNQKICSDAYSGSSIVTPRMICAGMMKTGGIDACHGDSGGPLVIDGVLIGITSWGRGCARIGYPGVWTRVPAFRNWIDSNIP